MWHDTNNFPVDSQPMRMNKSRETKANFSTHSEKDVSNSYLSCPLTKFLSCSFFLTYVLWYEQPSTWTDLLCNYQALKEIITCILSFKPPTPHPHSHTHTTLLSYTIPVGFPGLITTRPLGLQCSLDLSNALLSSQTSKAQSLSSSKK